MNEKAPRPSKLTYPEDRLIRKLFLRFPELKEFPVDILSGDLHVSKRFGLAQLELMERHGLTEEQAFDRAFRELRIQEHGAHLKPPVSPPAPQLLNPDALSPFSGPCRLGYQGAPATGACPQGPGQGSAAQAAPGR